MTEFDTKNNSSPVLELPNRELHLLFPNEPCIADPYTGRYDANKHPVSFLVNNYGAFESYGFRLTSHPEETELDDFLYVHLKKDDFDQNNKEASSIHCDNVTIFGTDEHKKNNPDIYLDHRFSRKDAKIKAERYNEIMTEVVVKHILLQEEGLALKDEYTDCLLMELNIEDRQDIISTNRYQQYHFQLYGGNLPLEEQRETRMEAIQARRDYIKSLEQTRQI